MYGLEHLSICLNAFFASASTPTPKSLQPWTLSLEQKPKLISVNGPNNPVLDDNTCCQSRALRKQIVNEIVKHKAAR